MTTQQHSQAGGQERVWQGSVSFEKTNPEVDAAMFEKIAAFTKAQGGFCDPEPQECRFRNRGTVWSIGVTLPGGVDPWPYRRDMEDKVLGKGRALRDTHKICALQLGFAPGGTMAKFSRIMARLPHVRARRPSGSFDEKTVARKIYAAMRSKITLSPAPAPGFRVKTNMPSV